MTEEWREIHNAPRYLVSNCGEVFDTRMKRYLKQTPDKSGYMYVKLWTSTGRMTVSVHRLVARAFLGTPYGRPEVNHKDLVKSNNQVKNLEMTTRSRNMKHAYASGVVRLPRETKVLCVETGRVFRTMREAARSIGCSDHKSIVRVLDNPNRSARGFHFETIT